MGIFRVKKNNNYSVINNTGLKDKNLSWKAKGILAYALTLPDDWTFHIEELVNHAKDGEDSLRSGINELKKNRYIKRYPVRHEKTKKITHWEFELYEKPYEEKPDVGNPDMDNPEKEKPHVEDLHLEKPTLLNTNKPSTKELSTNKQNTNLQSSSNIFTFYENNFGILNPFVADSITQWANDTSEELVQAAMERALKQQKKWNYAEGILKQWVNNNVKTLNDVQALEEEYKRKKGAKANGSGGKSDDSDFEYIGL